MLAGVKVVAGCVGNGAPANVNCRGKKVRDKATGGPLLVGDNDVTYWEPFQGEKAGS